VIHLLPLPSLWGSGQKWGLSPAFPPFPSSAGPVGNPESSPFSIYSLDQFCHPMWSRLPTDTPVPLPSCCFFCSLSSYSAPSSSGS
jgi:hypothetical protein